MTGRKHANRYSDGAQQKVRAVPKSQPSYIIVYLNTRLICFSLFITTYGSLGSVNNLYT
jgi:hypothetical protein